MFRKYLVLIMGEFVPTLWGKQKQNTLLLITNKTEKIHPLGCSANLLPVLNVISYSPNGSFICQLSQAEIKHDLLASVNTSFLAAVKLKFCSTLGCILYSQSTAEENQVVLCYGICFPRMKFKCFFERAASL